MLVNTNGRKNIFNTALLEMYSQKSPIGQCSINIKTLKQGLLSHARNAKPPQISTSVIAFVYFLRKPRAKQEQ